jgi:hypothetical protein
MSHFAKVENGIVTQVIVAEQEFINAGDLGDPSQWVQTSYNTHAGIHFGRDGKPDGGIALRGNYAGKGYIYDSVNDVFYTQRPKDRNGIECASWTISAPKWLWSPPTRMPIDDNSYAWDEPTQSWIMHVYEPSV